MKSSRGLCSYALPESVHLELATPDLFWDLLYDSATLVEQIPGYTPETWRTLLEFLGVDLGVEFPIGRKMLYPISGESSLTGVFSRSDLRTIHTRVSRLEREANTASEVLSTYGVKVNAPTNWDQDWLGYLMRQYPHLKSNEEVLVIACYQGAL